ncbi:TPA: oligosaccharide flippase family protein [Vibrio vulnificus]|nr:oligosaccharide flippase family protein [Vibrio vulnificus]
MGMEKHANEFLMYWRVIVFKLLVTYFSANLTAQLITLLSYPLITRVYSQSELGLASPVVMGLAMFMSFSSLNLPYYAMTLREAEGRNDAFAASLQATIMLLPFISLISIGYFYSVEHYRSDLIELLCMVMLAFVGSSLLLVTERFLQYQNRFNTVSFSLLLAAVTGVAVKLLFAYLGAGYWGLINAFLLGLIVQISVCMAVCLSQNDFKQIFVLHSRAKLLFFIRQTQFTFYRTSQAFVWFVATVAVSSIVLLLYGEAAAGVFSLAWLMSSAVANVLGKVLFDVYFSNASKLTTLEFIEQSKKYWSNLAKIVPFLFVISPFAYFIAGPLFGAVFGANWSESGYIGVVLLCSFGLGSVLAPVYIAYIRWEKQHVQLVFSILTFILPISAIYSCNLLDLTMKTAIFCYGTVNVFLLCLSAIYCYKLAFQSKHSEKNSVRN